MSKANRKDPVYSYTLRTDKPWVWRLANLETGETFAFSVRDGRLVLVREVCPGGR